MCCWVRKMRVQRASEHDLGSIHGVRWVHRPNGPQFNMAVRITSEHTHAWNAWARIRAVHVIWLLHTEIVWHTSQSPYTIWCSPTRRYCHWDWRIGIGCAMAAERWVWANEISIFFLRRDQCLTHVLTWGICTHTNFTSEWSTQDRG